jgi:Sel1 repeat
MPKTRTPLTADEREGIVLAVNSVFARTACCASLVALLAPTVAGYGHGSRRNELSPQRQASKRAYRGDDELTRLRESAVHGDVQSAWNLCQLYSGAPPDSFRGRHVAQDDAVAVEWCRRAATHGHLRASGTLGAMYYTGRGVSQDFAEVLHWIQPPATAGVSEAQYLLGLLYANGQGVQRDESEAFSWFLRSAEQGYAFAQNFVATQYMSGQGTKRDHIEAQKWFNICAARASDAQNKCIGGRDMHAKSMSGTDLAEAQRRAHQWLASCSRPSEPRWNIVCQ